MSTEFTRHLWQLYEPVHAVTYFGTQARAAFESAGLRGFWRGYFAGRAAPLGAVAAAPVTAAFFSFAPAMVARAVPDVWQRASPDQALAARLDGAVAVLRAVLPAEPGRWEAAAGLLETAARAAVTDGRVLGAANAALPRPTDPLARLWQAATVLREHRGDGHVIALVDAELDGCQALVLRDALYGGREQLQPEPWLDRQRVGRRHPGSGAMRLAGRRRPAHCRGSGRSPGRGEPHRPAGRPALDHAQPGRAEPAGAAAAPLAEAAGGPRSLSQSDRPAQAGG